MPHDQHKLRYPFAMATQTHAKLPVLDFSIEELKPGSSSWLSARNEVCRVLEDYGYFVAELGNKVPLELHNTMFGGVRELFNFPTETKMKVTSDQIKPCHGYTPTAQYERMLIDNATSTEKIQKESANSYVRLIAELDQMVTRMIFENYGVEKYYGSHMEFATRSLVLLKYAEPQKSGTSKGVGIHTDKNFITILHQNHVKGLEIKTKDDDWIVFDPSPSSFIVLAGGALQVWSNDRIESCVHRVTLTESETRYSLGLFVFHDEILHVLEELVDEKYPLKYKPFNNFEFVKAQVQYGARGDLTVKAFCGV
ncbi:putative 2-oxoglutarate-dependent dioxygenase AOP1.2 [Morella rubra]|uniref:Putative 2-oxoglutarate-dependent dioxygenase AOP1.2 n=1 Tax=Morella rubra TaxID=262757 RepID=A0A6A1VN53_9ROSI|nr:putative 2-oxoglutarate-dependent dioxygenase AOP1.2 [Morella rubra]